MGQRLTGALIGGAFGMAFVVANASTPLGPTAALVFRIVAGASFLALLAAVRRAVALEASLLASRQQLDVNLFGHRYWQIVAAEVALLGIGSLVIWRVGAAAQTYLAWTALVVGAHFIAFRYAGVWSAGVVPPGVLLILFGLAGIVLAAASAPHWIPFVSGVLSGFTLLAGSLSIVAREAVRRRSAPKLKPTRWGPAPIATASVRSDGGLETCGPWRGGESTLLELTEKTIETVKEISQASEMSGLRIFVDPRSEHCLSLAAALVDAPAEGDEVVENGGAVVYVEAAAAEVLDEKVLDTGVDDGVVQFTLLDP
jgi:Fe-S cluster assembly iron-binding protein IscA